MYSEKEQGLKTLRRCLVGSLRNGTVDRWWVELKVVQCLLQLPRVKL